MGWVASDRRPPAPGPTREMEGWMDELGVAVGGHLEGCPGVTEDEEGDGDNCIDMRT